ncbi:MAG TPA: hypothetical protein VFX92_04500 [Candidatus Krumholzibacteria bacterium]|nr:hypothetical protein [Candidatus Krumholzibacteria bacterium]
MKLTRMIFSLVPVQVSVRARNRPRLAKARRFAKWNRAAVALPGLLLLAPSLRAQPVSGAWHVGPQPAVRAICHAGDSLWVGTAAGLFILNIRDGALIERVEAGARLPSASVRAIAATGDSVFVATDDGLAMFRGPDAHVFTPWAPSGLGALPLRGLNGVAIGANHDVLVATLGYGAGVITASGAYAITQRDSLLDDIVFDVRDRPAGGRYFATNAGLCAQFDDTTFAWYQAGSGLPRGETRQLAVGDDGVLYVLVSRQGIYRFESRATGLAAPDGIPLRDTRSLSAGVDGSVWACGNGWAAVGRRGKWEALTFPPEDDHASWRCVVADGAGAFLGSEGGVVLAVQRGGPLRADLGGGLPAPRVDGIAPDGRGGAWFVSGGRIVFADARARSLVVENGPADARAVTISPAGDVIVAGRWTVRQRGANGWVDLKPDVIETDPTFTAARADADGFLWVGTGSGAVYRYDGDIWLRIARGNETLDGRGIMDVRSAPGGTWAIGAGLPVRCVDGGVERFPGIDSSEVVVDLERSPAGDWVAVTGSRLFVFDGAADRWNITTPAALVGSSTAMAKAPGRYTAIAFDRGGALFVGTTGGLGVVTRAGARWLHAADGTGGGEVTDLVVDEDRLWIGFASDGISVLPLDGLR